MVTLGLHPDMLLIFALLTTVCCRCDAISVEANFNMDGVKGTITFNQLSPANQTVITVSLSGLDQYPSETFPWHIHNYPFTTQEHNPCSAASVGGHLDPFMASSRPDYSTSCSSNRSLCEVGDLSGKFGRLNAKTLVNETYKDENLPLYGVHSIVGRSVVIHHNDGTRWVCANVGYPSDVTVAYSPFRTVFAGNIFFIEPSSPMGLTTVFVQLSYVSGLLVNSSSHEWFIHNNTIGSDGNCVYAGPHYNPSDIIIEANDYSYCKPSNQTVCEVGDLTRKSSSLSFTNGQSVLFYTDINLPVKINGLNETILDRSVVINHENSPARMACANLFEYSPRIASAKFQEYGVSGQIVFKQSSPFSPTTVRIHLSGLSSGADGYHIHEFPVDETISGSSKCTAAGGHFNPRNIVRNSSSPATFDAYEIGDLSGKSTDLTNFDTYDLTYSDPYLGLFGMESIVGRSVVIHRPNGDRWLCANILYDADTVTITTEINDDTLQAKFVLSQKANDPYSETTILLDVNIGPPVMPTPTQSSPASTLHIGSGDMSDVPSPSAPPDNSGVRRKKDVYKRQTNASAIYLSIQESCEPGTSLANPYSAPSSCSRTNQLACPVGDLIGKHGPLSSGRNLITDLNLPLTGPNSVAGMVVAVIIGDVNSPIVGCMSIQSSVLPTTPTSPPTLTPIQTTAIASMSVAITTSISVTSTTPRVSGTSVPQDEGEGKSTSAVIGIACGIAGGVVLLLFVVFIICCYVRRRRRQKTQSVDFVRRSDSDKGYEPLQLELAKKGKSAGRKPKRSEEYVEL